MLLVPMTVNFFYLDGVIIQVVCSCIVNFVHTIKEIHDGGISP